MAATLLYPLPVPPPPVPPPEAFLCAGLSAKVFMFVIDFALLGSPSRASSQVGVLKSRQIGVQSVTIPSLHDLIEDGRHLAFEFLRAPPRRAIAQDVRIRQAAQQGRNRAGIGELAEADDRAQPHKPNGVSCQFVEQIESEAGFCVDSARAAQLAIRPGHLRRLKQIQSERWSRHFTEYAAKDFAREPSACWT